METSNIITLGILIIFVLLGIYEEREKKKIIIENLKKSNKDLKIRLSNLRSESSNKDIISIGFTFQDSTYNQDNLIINCKGFNFEQPIFGEDGCIEEFCVKKKYKNKKLSYEEFFKIEKGKEILERINEYNIEKNKEVFTSSIISEEGGMPALEEKCKTTIDVLNNIRTGYTEEHDFLGLSKYVRIDFIEKYDTNDNLIERIQKSSNHFYANSKTINEYVNNEIVEEKTFELDKATNLYSEEPTLITKYKYRKNGGLKQLETVELESNDLEKVYFMRVVNLKEFEKAVHKSNKYCKLKVLDFQYLKILSNLIFINETVCDFEISKERIYIKSEKITWYNNT